MQSKKDKKDLQDEVHEELEDDDEEEDHSVFNEKMQSRFYRKDFPEEGDLVIVSTLLYNKQWLIKIDTNYQST
jgi:hypothetical protein